MTIVSAGILAVLLPFILFDLIRRPSIRRIGIRNVTRRAREAALVVGGSLLATSLITASFVIGDSFDASIRNIAATHWGPTDEVIYVDSPTAATALLTEIETTDPAMIDGAITASFIRVAAGSIGEDRLVEPRVRLLEVDMASAQTFGSDASATGLDGIDLAHLAQDTVVINTELANDLGLQPDDPIDLFANGVGHQFTVAYVVPVQGLAGIGQIMAQPGAFTGQLQEASSISNAAVLVSNAGDVFTGAEQTSEVSSIIESAMAAAGVDGEIDDVKQSLLDDAAAEGAETTQLFGTIGGFSVIAGILLVINLFVMLASERKTELGTMRALGMSRGSIVRGFSLEGAIYGSVAAVLGALTGIGVGIAVVAYASNSLTSGGGITLSPSIQFSSLLSGAVIGFAISQLTVLFTSIKMTKLNIVRALKDLPEPKSIGHQTRNLVMGVVGVAGAAAVWVVFGDTQVGALAAPVLAALFAIPVLSRIIPSRLATTIGCAVGLGWSAVVFGLLPETMKNPDIAVFLLQGVILVGLGSTIVAMLDGVWLKVADKAAVGGVGTKLGMAHPLSRPVRSVMLVAMFALVLFTVTFMGIMNAVFQAQGPEMAHRAGGDYTMIVDSNPTSGFDPAELSAIEGIDLVTPVRTNEIEMANDVLSGEGDETEVVDTWDGSQRVSFVAPDFDQVTPPATMIRSEQFASDAEAWAAVLNPGTDDQVWVMSPDFSDLRVGQTITMFSDHGQAIEAKIAGKTEMGWMVGAGFYLPVELESRLSDHASPTTRFYMTAESGADPEVVAAALTADAPERGMNARAFTDAAQEELDGQETFLTMLQGYLGLGLLIGVAGLSVVLIRAVRERRRQIGMMRAIGIPASQVRSMFVVEALFIGLQGVVLGLGLGTLSSWQILTKSSAFERGLGFTIPAVWLVGLALFGLVVSVVAAIGPALLAGKESPAEALRFSG